MSLRQTTLMPEVKRPIVCIGAGGIVRSAHLPAYQLAGFDVAGVFDPRPRVAAQLAKDFAIGSVYGSFEQAVESAPEGAVFDVAVPADVLLDVVEGLPEGASAVLQKPMGQNLADATKILEAGRRKNLNAAVNFQLRTAPMCLAAQELIDSGQIGEVVDIEVRVNVHTPWQLWDFLERAPRMEILYHSIHYLDYIRSLWGEPTGVFARTFRHPSSPKLHSSRSTIILDYGEMKRAAIHTNHAHDFGPEEQASFIQIEGTEGAIKMQMGVNLDYPTGRPDSLRWVRRGSDWQSVELIGNWFPHAFVGPMASVMRTAEGFPAPTRLEDAWRTMSLVEACYVSDARGGIGPSR